MVQADRYRKVVRLGKKDVKELIGEVVHRLESLSSTPALRGFTSPLLARISALAAGVSLPPPLPTRRHRASKDASDKAAPHTVFEEGARTLRRLLAEEADGRLIFAEALNTIRAALRLRDCVLWVRDRNTSSLRAWFGDAGLLTAAENQRLGNASEKSVFTVSLSRGEDVLIHHPDDPGISNFIPSWLREAVK